VPEDERDEFLRNMQRHRAGEIEAPLLLWRALNLELWARQFLDDDGQRDA
jgi:hypothetical protein